MEKALCTQTIRREIRQRRRSITGSQRDEYSRRAAEILCQSALLESAQRVAVFLSLPEEIDTRPLIEMLWAQGKALYLPYVQAKDCPLLWLPYTAQTLLVPDGLGILAPAYEPKALLSPEDLSLIVMPLVSWDLSGTRLGMGGGYYDRTFATPNAHQSALRIGLAYECQRAETLTRQAWDLPLHHLATEQYFYSFPS